MKIAYLSGAYVPSRGANSMHVMAMCQAMAQLGHEVTLYVRPGDLMADDDFSFYGVEPLFRLLKQKRPQVRVWGALVSAWRTREALKRDERPDLVYARETWALSLAIGTEVPFVFESHWRPRNLFHRLAEIRILRHPLLRRVIFISEALRQIYFKEFPWLDPAITLVAHDAANMRPPHDSTDQVKLGRDSALQVGYVGSFQQGSGIELIAETAALLPEEDFHVFGGSPSEVRVWSDRTISVPNLHFHGFSPPKDLPGVYAALDVLLAPYQANTRHIGWISPMKLFEYMAHGKAIICSDFPVLREVVEHGVTGFLVDSDDSEAWANAIRGLRADPQMRTDLGTSGLEELARRFTWKHRAQKILEGIA